MDSLTAVIILICCRSALHWRWQVQLPPKKRTRHWALSGSYIALGVLIAILNSRQPRDFVFMAGGALIMAGLIYQ